MIRTPYPGAWYVDALPQGEYVVLYPESRFETDFAARLPFPAGETWGLSQLRLSPTRDRFMGLAHAEGPPTILEWRRVGGWHSIPTVFGFAVYAPDGTILHTVQPGYGYYDEEFGQPISRNQTVLPFHGLSNWSKIVPGLYIGQGHDSIAPPGAGGVILWDDIARVYRRLDTGNCSDINVHVDGQDVAISYMRAGEGAVIQRGTLADVRAIELYTPTTTKPDEPKEPPVPTFANHLDVVERERAKYGPTIGDAEAFAVTNAVALDPAVKAEGWGLTKAPTGAHGWIVNGQNYRVDKLCHPEGFINDVLGAMGENKGTPQWGPNPDPNGNPSNWAPAIGDVPPPPLPPSPDGDLAKLRNELHAAVADLLGKHDAQQKEINNATSAIKLLESDVEVLKHAPPPVAKLPTLAIQTNPKAPQLSTGSRFGHSHPINLEIVVVPE